MIDLSNMASDDIYNLALKYENDKNIPQNLEESTRLLKMAAERQNILAMNQYGVHLLKGIGSTINKEEASIFFNKSADLGNVEASYNFANMLYKGDGIPKDIKKAEIYYKIAADKGKVEAQIKYGRMILKRRLHGISPENCQEAEKYFKMVSKVDPLISSYYMVKLKEKIGYPMTEEQYEEVMQDFKKLSDKGCLKAMHVYADNLYTFSHTEKDKEEALKLLKFAADKGHLKSIVSYSTFVDNFDEKIKYIKMSMELGDENSLERLADCYYRYDKYDEAAKNYKILANNGDHHALIRLCYILCGKNIEFDTKKKIEYFEKAVARGETYLGYEIGLIKYNGLGGEKVDKVEAAKWFKKMADKNEINSTIKYCEMCHTGDGIPINLKEAAKYYQKMVDKASYDKIATYRYATMLYFGDKITPDFEKAAFLYEKAAELKNPDAMFALGTMYYRGQGVLKNIGKAIQLYKKAGSLGHQKAKEFLQILCKPKKVTPKEEEIKTENKAKLILNSSESEDDDHEYQPKEIYIAPFHEGNANFKCQGSFKFNGKYLMIFENFLYKWKGDKTYVFDGTYLRPNDDSVHYNELNSIYDGTYKFDGTYFMPFENGEFQAKRNGTYKFDGTYLIPFENGEFQSNNPGTYKYDGTYLIPYDNGQFNKNNKGTYIFSKECECPFIILPSIK